MTTDVWARGVWRAAKPILAGAFVGAIAFGVCERTAVIGVGMPLGFALERCTHQTWTAGRQIVLYLVTALVLGGIVVAGRAFRSA